MDLIEAINKRHSVRQYKNTPIEGKVKEELCSFINDINKESGLNIQLILNEPRGFDGLMAKYVKLIGVKNYLAIVGKKQNKTEEKCGYYGEKIVLKAQQLGLNSCWVALTYKKIKTAFKVEKGENLFLVIALGYGKLNGVSHKSKDFDEVVSQKKDLPLWFIEGVNMALLAPTAMNQQKFIFTLKEGNKVKAEALKGFYTKIDLGIVKYHFEIGAGKENFAWEE